MWIFAGLVVLSFTVWYTGARIAMALRGILAVTEASINRVAKRTGEPPIMADVDADQIRR